MLSLLFTLAREKKGGFRIEGGLAGWRCLDEGLARQTSLLASGHRCEVGPDDTALFQYSGGTTGVSKGAVALHRNVVANTLQIKAWFVIMEDGKETLLMAIPLFHVYGMVAGMLYAIAIGATMVMIPNARDIPDVLENINKYHPTDFPGRAHALQRHQQSPRCQSGKGQPALHQGLHLRLGAAAARDQGDSSRS